jgi:hypothetical protein
VDHALSGRRFAARVEAAVYFCCTQTRASSAELTPSGTDLVLTLFDVDDVPQDVVDRVEAAGGSVSTSDHVLSVVLPALG